MCLRTLSLIALVRQDLKCIASAITDHAGVSARRFNGNGPVMNITSDDIRCNAYDEGTDMPAADVVSVNAGEDIVLRWTEWPIEHPGPILTYMASLNHMLIEPKLTCDNAGSLRERRLHNLSSRTRCGLVQGARGWVRQISVR